MDILKKKYALPSLIRNVALGKSTKINKRTPMFIPESRVCIHNNKTFKKRSAFPSKYFRELKWISALGLKLPFFCPCSSYSMPNRYLPRISTRYSPEGSINFKLNHAFYVWEEFAIICCHCPQLILSLTLLKLK